jgi:hypothetical protein
MESHGINKEALIVIAKNIIISQRKYTQQNQTILVVITGHVNNI